jgi:hypothetical protein
MSICTVKGLTEGIKLQLVPTGQKEKYEEGIKNEVRKG